MSTISHHPQAPPRIAASSAGLNERAVAGEFIQVIAKTKQNIAELRMKVAMRISECREEAEKKAHPQREWTIHDKIIQTHIDPKRIEIVLWRIPAHFKAVALRERTTYSIDFYPD